MGHAERGVSLHVVLAYFGIVVLECLFNLIELVFPVLDIVVLLLPCHEICVCTLMREFNGDGNKRVFD